MQYRWSTFPKLDDRKVESLSGSINVSPQVATLLLQRGIETFDEAKRFFRPQLSDLHDPFLMKDMDKAIERLQDAVAKDEKILVYGDYDVDGTTAVSTVYSFFRGITRQLDFYIPDRYKEGYGVSKAGIDWAAENGFSLIVALDCGTRSVELVKYARSLGIDFIICDHHLPGSELPEAVALLNPKRSDCSYPYKELSGCGIGFKLIQAYAQVNEIPFEDITRYLDLVAVSTCSDIVEMKDENRVLVYFGLKKINEDPCIGLQALLQSYQMRERYEVNDIVFGIGPRINAAGRIADAKASVRLLIEENFHKAMEFSRLLNENNAERKDLDTDITRDALTMIDNSPELQKRKSTVLFGKNWHKGVIGIVASRLIESYYRPTIIFSEVNGLLTGSARSVKDFDIHEAIGACGDVVVQYGGHKYAAGLSIKAEDFEIFSERFEQIVSDTIREENLVPEILYDIELDFADINKKFFNLIEQFKPHGPGNMTPVFRTSGLKDNASKIVKDKHLKLSAVHKGTKMEGIGFGLGDHYKTITAAKQGFDVCYSVEMNEFNGQQNLQLRIRDIR